MPIAVTATAPRNLEGRPAMGVMDSIRTTLATIPNLLRTRLEIISTELEEQREWLQNILILMVVGLFCACMGMVMVTLFVVAMFWDTHPVAVLGVFSALYLGVGAWAIFSVKSKLGNRPKLFSTTTSELEKDEDQLRVKR